MKSLAPFSSVAFFIVALNAGCSQMSAVGQAQDAARDHNLNTRMGRIELAAEQVHPEFQQTWAKSHQEWGKILRLADSEMAGVRKVSSKEVALYGTKSGADSENKSSASTQKTESVPKAKEDEEELYAFVKVAWYRLDEGELHNTLLRQRWRNIKGMWLLVAEDRENGDEGLLGDSIARDPVQPFQKKSVQFPSIRLGGE